MKGSRFFPRLINMPALAASSTRGGSIEAVAADLQVARDYRDYLANTEVINLMMALHPDSTFATGWQLTLLRAQELGLNQVGEAEGWTATLETGSASQGVDPHTGRAFEAHQTVRDANGALTQEQFYFEDGSLYECSRSATQDLIRFGNTSGEIKSLASLARGRQNRSAQGSRRRDGRMTARAA